MNPPIPPPTASDMQRDAEPKREAEGYGDRAVTIEWYNWQRGLWHRRISNAESQRDAAERRADDLDSRLADAEAELQNHPTTEEHKIALSERNRFAAEFAAARERVAMLETALRPFAEYADQLDSAGCPDAAPCAYFPGLGINTNNPTCGHHRAARAALARAGRGEVRERGPYCVYCGKKDCTRDHHSIPGPWPVPNYRSCCGQVVTAYGCEWGHKKDCPTRAGRGGEGRDGS